MRAARHRSFRMQRVLFGNYIGWKLEGITVPSYVYWRVKSSECVFQARTEVRKMKTFKVEFQFQDRKSEPQTSNVKIDASSMPGAIAKATREFVKGLDRKQRFDMNKNGLEIKAVHVEIDEGSAEAESASA
jgi:hypothetical protein